METDDFASFRALVDQLEPDDREEVLQMFKKAYHFFYIYLFLMTFSSVLPLSAHTLDHTQSNSIDIGDLLKPIRPVTN